MAVRVSMTDARKCLIGRVRRKCNRSRPVPIMISPSVGEEPQENYSFVRNGLTKADISQFQMLKVLGEGSFAKVFLVRKIVGADCGKLYAMKALKKATLLVKDKYRTKLERNILVDVKHPFIVKLHYAFQTAGKLFFILDFLRGGDLFSRLNNEVMLLEEDAKFYLAELALAIDHLHSLGIIYRDLKPENILLDTEGHIALTDFGLSGLLPDEENRTYSFCGTIEYTAPEIVQQSGHSAAADWWSYGVLMYEMLTGIRPFQGSNNIETMRLISDAKVGMPTHLSVQSQNLLRALLKKRPEKRLGFAQNGIEDLKKHEFFAKIDFDALLSKKIKPPFQPSVCGPEDAYFDSKYTSKTPTDSPASGTGSASDKLFEGFSFIDPCLLEKGTVATEKSEAPFIKEYVLMEKIGTGNNRARTVQKAKHKSTGQHYAVKIINKSFCDSKEEVDIMSRYNQHPGIVTMNAMYEDSNNVYLVLELLKGGDLMDYYMRKGRVSEQEAAVILKTLATTVAHLHENNVVRLHLKTFDIFFASENCDPDSVKICDMSSAKQVELRIIPLRPILLSSMHKKINRDENHTTNLRTLNS